MRLSGPQVVPCGTESTPPISNRPIRSSTWNDAEHQCLRTVPNPYPEVPRGPTPPRTAPFSVNCCYFRREFDDENCERTHSATAFVVTPTLEPSLSRPINAAEATVALKSAPATPNGPICALHPDHVRQSTAKFGAPTIDPKPPTQEMARTPPPPASRHNPGGPTLPRAPRTG